MALKSFFEKYLPKIVSYLDDGSSLDSIIARLVSTTETVNGSKLLSTLESVFTYGDIRKTKELMLNRLECYYYLYDNCLIRIDDCNSQKSFTYLRYTSENYFISSSSTDEIKVEIDLPFWELMEKTFDSALKDKSLDDSVRLCEIYFYEIEPFNKLQATGYLESLFKDILKSRKHLSSPDQELFKNELDQLRETCIIMIST